MTALLKFFWPLLKTFFITGCFPFKKTSDSFIGFEAIKTRFYILLPICFQGLPMVLYFLYQFASKTTDTFDSSFEALALDQKSPLDSALYYCLAASVIVHFIISGLIWQKRYSYISLVEYLEQFQVKEENLWTEKLLIIFSFGSFISGFALQLLWIIYRIVNGESINEVMSIIDAILFILQYYGPNSPIFSFIIMYGNVCTNIRLILKDKMEKIQNNGKYLRECESFFIDGIRKANEFFSSFLFLIIGQYLIAVTFGSYSTIFTVLSIDGLHLKYLCFGISQVLLTFYVASIVFVINHFSDEVSSTFQSYKV